MTSSGLLVVTAWYLKPQVSKADTDKFIASGGEKMEL